MLLRIMGEIVGLVCLYGRVLCFAVRSVYDARGIDFDGGAGDVILDFEDAGRQRLSAYCVGIDTLLRLARIKLKEADAARTA